ncbi:hypothetical protein [Bacillus horti]|uniref:MFS family permease n=1 Tax=Caldalkalibacillus horti TaxID=77523 RepID=A0ABT9W3R8_9BACI|nr:hypothetical protein [Bacillus horti]MDQ0167490.1 MFS family permease [Bacillus horti]
MTPTDRQRTIQDTDRSSVTFKDRLTMLLGIITCSIAILYLVHVFVPSIWLERVYSLLTIILLVFGVFSVRKGNQIAVILLLIGGFLIFLMYRIDPWVVIEGFGQNINLLTLFFVVPLIGIVISAGGYLTALKYKLMQLQQGKEAHPYRWSALLTASMGLILNLGSLPLIYRIAQESFPSFEQKKMGVVLLRAFTFCMFWSPYFVNVGLILVLFDLSWVEVGWVGLLLAIAYSVLATVFFKRIQFHEDSFSRAPMDKASYNEMDISRKIKSLAIWASVLIILSFTFDMLTELSMLTVVSLMAVFYPLAWAIRIGILQDFIHSVVEYIKGSFTRLKNEVVVFISAGFFGMAISYTNVGEIISTLIYRFSFEMTYLLALLIIVFTVTLAAIGIHPIIVVVGIGSSLEPSVLGVSPVFLAANLLMAWGLATSLSPFSGSILMVSSITDESPWTIARQNLSFNLVCLLVLPLLLYSLHRIGII